MSPIDDSSILFLFFCFFSILFFPFLDVNFAYFYFLSWNRFLANSVNLSEVMLDWIQSLVTKC